MSCCLLIGDYLLRGEPIPFNTVSVMNDPGGNGTFNSGTNALHLVFSDSGTSTLLAGTKSGNQISGEYTVAENSTPVDSGTFTLSLLMHPADPTRLDTTSFRVAGSNLSGMRMPVKQGTEEAYSVTFYGGGIPRRQVVWWAT